MACYIRIRHTMSSTGISNTQQNILTKINKRINSNRIEGYINNELESKTNRNAEINEGSGASVSY